MASTGIQWSGTSGHLRLGIQVRWDDIGPSTTAVNVFVDYYVQSQAWGYNDSQTLHYGGSRAGTVNYTLSTPAGSTTTVLIHTETIASQGLSYGGGPTYTFNGSVSGAFDGSAPSLGINWTLPARQAQAPSAPGIGVDSVTTVAARVVVSAADPRGSTIRGYHVWLSRNSGFTDLVFNQSTGGTVNIGGLTPATTYYARTQAWNDVGWGDMSRTVSFTTGGNVPAVPPSFSVGSVTQTGATLTFGTPSNGGSAITNYTVQIATNSSFTTGVVTSVHEESPVVLTNLQPGQPYWARVRANNGVGAGPYTASSAFTTLAGTPTIMAPVANETKTTQASYPYASVRAVGVAAGQVLRAEFSKDNTFATGVIAVEVTLSGKVATNTYTVQDTSQYLSNGTWYVRANSKTAATGYTTPWSPTVTFTESHTPSASVVSPTSGATISYTASTQFQWRFNDLGAPVDTMTAYQLVIENNDTGATVYDSGKTALVGSSTDTITRGVTLASTLKNAVLRWRVKVWDRGDVESNWTGYSLFILADPPQITVTSPAPGLDVETGAPTFSWTTVIPSGGSQVRAFVQVFDTFADTLVWESEIIGTRQSTSPGVVILTNERTYNYTLTITDSTGLSATATGEFVTNYQSPDSLPYSISALNVDSLGYVLVSWPNADPDDTFVSWKVYRRNNMTTGTWELLEEIKDQNIRQYRDYLVAAGDTYSYSLTQTATRSGIVLESSVGYYLTGADVVTLESRMFTMELSNYWLINPKNQDLSLQLPHVISDDSTLEFETSTYTVIGRGRHRDEGDELGYTGTLVCQVMGSDRINPFRLAMENLRRSKETYWLRNPFGRLYPVALGNLGWNPRAGTGTMEMGEMSIPYEQVA